MTILRAQVTIPRDTGLPEDVVTNTFHFNTGGDYLVTDGPTIAQRVQDFYNRVTNGLSIQQMLSKANTLVGTRIKVYDLSDPKPRVPKIDQAMALAEPTFAGSLPSELAVCASFHSAYGSGVINARARGRIYLGPLNDSAMQLVNNEPYVAPAVLATCNAAMLGLVAQNTPLLKWATYSQTLAATTGPVVAGWTDNAFDIQRRRGVKPTTRSTWAAA